MGLKIIKMFNCIVPVAYDYFSYSNSQCNLENFLAASWLSLNSALYKEELTPQVSACCRILSHLGVQNSFWNFDITQVIIIINKIIARTFRTHAHVSGYFLIPNLFYPDTASVHTHPASSTANPDIFKSATFCSRIRLPTTPIW